MDESEKKAARSEPPRQKQIAPNVVDRESRVNDEDVYRRLAALSPAEYDRCRKAEAETLGIRTETLDLEVAARRPERRGNMQGSAVEFPNVEPWNSPVDGAQVLNEVAATFSRYLVLPAGGADAMAMWTAHAHCFDAFQFTPRLNFASPDKRCGKTTALDVLWTIVPRALRAENMTTAVMFRLVEA